MSRSTSLFDVEGSQLRLVECAETETLRRKRYGSNLDGASPLVMAQPKLIAHVPDGSRCADFKDKGALEQQGARNWTPTRSLLRLFGKTTCASFKLKQDTRESTQLYAIRVWLSNASALSSSPVGSAVGVAVSSGSRASNLPRQCWQVSCRPKCSTRIRSERPQVGQS